MDILAEDDWKVLIHSIRKGKCILLTGPGAAVDPDNELCEPLPMQLSRELFQHLDKAEKAKEIVEADDLAHVAQIYERTMSKKRPGLEIAVEDFYAKYRNRTTQFHRDLASLPFKLCITTTPELFLLNAFYEIDRKQPLYDFYQFERDARRARQRTAIVPPEDATDQPLIYDLYGSLREPDSLVLSENDLLNLLTSVTKGSPALHPYVSSQFSDPETSFLFLGFGFKHWYVRILLHVLKAAGHRSPSLALEDQSFFEFPQVRQTAVFFQSGHSIDFCKLSCFSFAKELRSRFETDSATDRYERVARPGAPIAFICHENRDKITAGKIAEQLRLKGIDIWIDKQSLRGGDEWDKAIDHVLNKQTDYVLVLQSPNMLDKPESYFRKEIRIAIARQEKFAPEFRFIIPVLIEKHPHLPLSNLGHLHNPTMMNGSEIESVAQSILEDWNQRRQSKFDNRRA